MTTTRSTATRRQRRRSRGGGVGDDRGGRPALDLAGRVVALDAPATRAHRSPERSEQRRSALSRRRRFHTWAAVHHGRVAIGLRGGRRAATTPPGSTEVSSSVIVAHRRAPLEATSLDHGADGVGRGSRWVPLRSAPGAKIGARDLDRGTSTTRSRHRGDAEPDGRAGRPRRSTPSMPGPRRGATNEAGNGVGSESTVTSTSGPAVGCDGVDRAGRTAAADLEVSRPDRRDRRPRPPPSRSEPKPVWMRGSRASATGR